MKFLQVLWVPIALSALVTAVSSASEGHDVGNGGNAVVCYADESKQEVVSVELFDYWEMKRARPAAGPIDLGAPGLSVREKISLALDRVAKFDPVRAGEYRMDAFGLVDRIDSYLVDALPTVQDDQSAFHPDAPCYKEQFAVQVKNPPPGETRFRVSRALYTNSRATNDARAGLILHEVIYREAIRGGQTNSDATRAYNFLIATRALESATIPEYTQLLTTLGLDYPNCAPVMLKGLNQILFLDSLRRSVCAPSVLHVKDARLEIKRGAAELAEGDRLERFSFGGMLFLTRPEGTFKFPSSAANDGVIHVEFAHRDRISSISLMNVQPVSTFEFPLRFEGQSIPCSSSLGKYFFRADGELLGCMSGSNVTLAYGGENWELFSMNMDGGMIRFDEQFRLREAPLRTPRVFTVSGTNQKFEFNGQVTLDENGNLVSGRLVNPIERVVNGIPSTLHDINDASGGRARANVYHRLSPEWKGMQILYPSTNSSADRHVLFQELCQLKGYPNIDVNMPGLKEIFVSGSQQIFDLERKTAVTVVDERVKIAVGKLNCYGQSEFEL